MPAIETARLRLKCFTETDLENYARIFADPEYTRYSPKGSVPLEQVKEAARYSLRLNKRNCNKN